MIRIIEGPHHAELCAPSVISGKREERGFRSAREVLPRLLSIRIPRRSHQVHRRNSQEDPNQQQLDVADHMTRSEEVGKVRSQASGIPPLRPPVWFAHSLTRTDAVESPFSRGDLAQFRPHDATRAPIRPASSASLRPSLGGQSVSGTPLQVVQPQGSVNQPLTRRRPASPRDAGRIKSIEMNAPRSLAFYTAK
jgi:hypothetical protein